jgi:glycosyltransferase involved in cell wall biosynthesis
MKTSPVITVLMPVYDCAAYVESAVRSVLDQTFTDFEFLIIDDGSTDDTRKKILRFNDERIKIFPREREGLVSQLNFGLKQARGEFIARTDGDDIMVPHRLRIQLQFLKSHHEVGVVGSSFIMIDEKENQIGIERYPETDEEIRNAFPVYNPIPHPSVMYRRSLVMSVNGYRDEFFPVEDLDLWLRLSRSTTFSNIDDPLMLKRVGKNSVTALHQKETKAVHLLLGRQYLNDEMKFVRTKDEQFQLELKMARCEYYYGMPTMSRSLFVSLLRRRPYNLVVLRYLLSSALSENAKNKIRSSRLLNALKKTKILRSRKYQI